MTIKASLADALRWLPAGGIDGEHRSHLPSKLRFELHPIVVA